MGANGSDFQLLEDSQQLERLTVSCQWSLVCDGEGLSQFVFFVCL